MKPIYDITSLTLLDYPGELACIAWISKCNLRCVYCHNPDIIASSGKKEASDLISFLKKRQNQLTGVVFSGGEATFYSELPKLIAQVKSLGYKVKLDTNGTNPKMINELLSMKVLNYVALDYKCNREKSKELIGTDKFYNAFRESLEQLIKADNKDLHLEIRTTYYSTILTESDLNDIIIDLDDLGFTGTYAIQNVIATGNDTFGKINKPVRSLNKEAIVDAKNFKIIYRNF